MNGAAARDRETLIGIGARIRQARLAAGLTQEQAADRVSVSRSAWSLWECARYCVGALEVIHIAEALGVTVGWLLLGEVGEDGITRGGGAAWPDLLNRALSIAAREVAAGTGADPEIFRMAWLADAQSAGSS